MASQSSTPSKGQSPRVLLVDDEPAIAHVLARPLRRRGLVVDFAPSAVHALRVLERRGYAVVVADQYMPGPHGAELLASVALRWPETRLILMSAFLDAEMLAACPAAHRVIDKSFTLMRIVEVILEEASLARP